MERRNGSTNHSAPASIPGELQQKLLELQEEKKAIFETSGDAIFVVHPISAEIIEANARASSLTGFNLSELLQMRFDRLIPQHQRFTRTPGFRASHGRGSWTVLRRRDGSSICVDLTACSTHRGRKAMRLIFVRNSEDDKLSQPEAPVAAESRHHASPEPNKIDTHFSFPNIIGKSEGIRAICHRIGQVAKTDCTVLIQGESGTGKEMVAHATHFHSDRAKGPFVKVNCAALPEPLLESELFGHVRGAFTGAIRDRTGRFLQADGGTILLDEISCVSLAGQAKLLRVLEEREFEPVGSSVTKSVNVRVIAASNSNLEKEVGEGTFRKDLFYRLNVFSLCMPPLRERKEDIPLLAHHFLKQSNLAVGKKITQFTPQTLALMMHCDWPGNVRELENAIEHCVIVCSGNAVLPSNLPSSLMGASDAGQEEHVRGVFSEGLSLRDKLNLIEKQMIKVALDSAAGVKKDAAAILKIDPRNFPYLLRKHGIT